MFTEQSTVIRRLQTSVRRFENLEKMDPFLGYHTLAKCNQDETGALDGAAVTPLNLQLKCSPRIKCPGLDASPEKSMKYLKNHH